MIKNRTFSLCFRLFVLAVCLITLLYNLGLLEGKPEFAHALYFTFQSNFLVFITFGVLAVKDIINIKQGDKKGSCLYFPRFCTCALTSIVLTFIVFWSLLAWEMHDPEYLTSYHNLSVHFITPILMIADYTMFSERGKLKKHDPLLFAIFPLIYFIQATILGLAGVNYKLSETISGIEIQHFPYPFIDYYELGWLVLPCVIAITGFIIGFSYLFYYLDKKYHMKSNELRKQTN